MIEQHQADMPPDERFRRMKRQRTELFAALVMVIDAATFSSSPSYDRASGSAVCNTCGLDYSDHPRWERHNLYRTCDGRWWHL